MKTKSETAFNGVVILTLALIIVKILSAIYRIPYQNVLGDDGLYAYQQIYPVVALGVILSMNAIPSAVTQVIGVNRSDEVYTRVMFRLQCIGFIVFILLFMFANMITRWMGDSNLAPMLKMASFSFILIGVLGVLRGFYQSKQVMTIPAISQVIMFSMKHWSIYQAGALAILASSIGFLGSMLYLLLKKPLKLKLCYRFNNTSIQWKQLFISISIFALSQLIVILWQVVDSFTIIRLLQHSGIAFKEAIIQKGIYDRGASFIQMGLIVTTTFSFVLIPLLTQAIREHNQIHMNRYANASIKITVVISTAASIGLINLLPLMNVVFFKSNHLTLTLSIYMFTVICVSLIMMNISLLQVQTSIRPIIMGVIIGILSKIILNVILIPFWGIVGASVSTVLSLLLFVIILQVAVLKYYRFNRISLFIVKLILGMIIMSIVVQTVMLALPSKSRMLGLLELIVSSIIGIVIIMLYIVIFNVLGYKEIKHLPFGDKLYQMKRGRRS
ncbi:MAG: oligosaccharide flippase family protein [Staphylococcus epidermidis]|nr:oligosaccharide flippase family protein [Staphylococcus epidermidis]